MIAYSEFSTSSNVSLQEISAACSASSLSVAVGTEIQFTDLTAGSPTTWAWDFGDGSTSTDQNPAHTYMAAGSYTVTLSVSNGVDSGTATLSIYIYEYTIITPPDDGSAGYWIKTDAHYYIIDAVNNRILIYDLALIYEGYFSLLYAPSYLAWDGTYLYIADPVNAKIQIFDAGGAYLDQFMVDGIPYGVATNGVYIYVTDTLNNEVKVYEMSGVYVESFGVSGQRMDGELKTPKGIACDANGLYIIDSGNNRLQAFLYNYAWVTSLGSYGSAIGEFNNPTDCWLYGGVLTIADEGNSRSVAFSVAPIIMLSGDTSEDSTINFDINGMGI
jgi:PKD repeat protein